jgi:DNA-binding response OmpR family regulator
MQPAVGPLNGLRILVIADAFESVEAVVGYLRSLGTVAVALPTAALGLAYSQQHTVDVVLVDSRKSDWWFAPEIRALRSVSRAPLYALTEPGQTLDPTAGVDGYFPKPVRIDALVATLAVLPRRSR